MPNEGNIPLAERTTGLDGVIVSPEPWRSDDG